MKSAAAAPSLPAVPISSPPKAGASHFAERTGLNSLLSATSSIEQPALPSATPAPINSKITGATSTLRQMEMSDVSPSPPKIHPTIHAYYQRVWENFKVRVREGKVSSPTPPLSIARQEAPVLSKPQRMSKYLAHETFALEDPVNLHAGVDKREIYSSKNCLLTLAGIKKTSLEALLKKADIPDIDVRMTGQEIEALFTIVGEYYGNTRGINRDQFWDTYGLRQYLADSVLQHPGLVSKLVLGMVPEKTKEDNKDTAAEVVVVMAWSENSELQYRLFRCLEDKSTNTITAEKLSSFSNLPPSSTLWLYETSERELKTEDGKEPEMLGLTSDQQQFSLNSPPRPLMLAAWSWGVTSLADFEKLDDEPGASALSECLDAFRVYVNIHHDDHSAVRKVMVKELSYMATHPEMRTPFFDFAYEFPRNASNRTLAILNTMKSARQKDMERIVGKKLNPLLSLPNNDNSLDWSTPTYGPDANVWRTLSGLVKEPVESITAKTGIRQSDQKLNLKQLQGLFVAVGYEGKMIGFCSANEVKKYLTSSVRKAPKLILYLMLGYVQTNGEVKIFEVKAWLPRSQYEKLIGKPIESKMSAALVEVKDSAEKKPPPYTISYRLTEHTSDGPRDAGDLLSTPLPCKFFWLYETGKRYRATT